MKRIKDFSWANLAFILGTIALAAILRLTLLDFKSVDYFKYTKSWYNTIMSEGFSSFGHLFSNYNLPYLYLLYIIARFTPNTPSLIATKLPSLLADFVMGYAVYRIVCLKYETSSLPLFAAFAVLFAPTIVLNSAFWGQADALYTCALIICIFFLLKKEHAPALLFFGISLSFKAQALFLSPLLFALFLRREISWKYFLIVPFILLLAVIPAWIAGRPLTDLLLIYPAQAGQYEQLSMHAPSFLSWVPNSGRFYPYFYPAGLVLTTAICLFFVVFVYSSGEEMRASIIVELALISVMLMPFFLPKMHERYFYAADVISVIFAFYHPRYYYVPIAMNVISFFSYQPTLFGVETIPISLLSLGVLILLVIVTKDAATNLFPLAKQQTQ